MKIGPWKNFLLYGIAVPVQVVMTPVVIRCSSVIQHCTQTFLFGWKERKGLVLIALCMHDHLDVSLGTVTFSILLLQNTYPKKYIIVVYGQRLVVFLVPMSMVSRASLLSCNSRKNTSTGLQKLCTKGCACLFSHIFLNFLT